MQDSRAGFVPPAGGTVDTVLDVVLSLFAMAAEVIPCTNEPLRRKVIVILCCCNMFDANIHSDDRSGNCPGWVTSFNFSCLIKLQDTVAKFGPMYNLWVGAGKQYLERIGNSVLLTTHSLTCLHNSWNRNVILLK